MKKVLSLTFATILALTMTACGSSGSGEPTEKDFEKAAEKLDSMTEEDFEKAVGEGGSNGSDEKQEPVILITSLIRRLRTSLTSR